jgi:predicted transposase/invertase (TIGR01784 family)
MYDDITFKIINVGNERINRLNDRYARYLLGGSGNKSFLIAFINAVLLLEGNDRIVDLEFIPGEIFGPDAKTKLSILDASVKLVDGRTTDVEVQIVNYHDFKKRGPYYWAKRHVQKLEKGSSMTYADIKPTITICLLAFDLLEEEEEYRNSYSIRNDKSGNRLCADMQIIYLELPKFLRSLGADHPRTGLERWLLYFSNEEGERMQKVMAEDNVLSQVKEVELSFWADETERESYFQQQQLLMDEYSAQHTYEVLLKQERDNAEKEKEKAAQEGLKQGLEQGLEQGRFEIARKMLARNMSIGDIIDLTGLDEKQILAIR